MVDLAEMVAINAVSDNSARVDFVAQVITKLPTSNRYLLGALVPVFVAICKANKINNMTGTYVRNIYTIHD